MYYAYCLIPIQQRWTPARRLQTVEAAFDYCRLQHRIFPEIRITDTEDHCVLHIVRHVMYCPLPDGTFSRFNLLTGAHDIVSREAIVSVLEEDEGDA